MQAMNIVGSLRQYKYEQHCSAHLRYQVRLNNIKELMVIPILNSSVLDHFEYSDDVCRLIVCSKKSLIIVL